MSLWTHSRRNPGLFPVPDRILTTSARTAPHMFVYSNHRVLISVHCDGLFCRDPSSPASSSYTCIFIYMHICICMFVAKRPKDVTARFFQWGHLFKNSDRSARCPRFFSFLGSQPKLDVFPRSPAEEDHLRPSTPSYAAMR